MYKASMGNLKPTEVTDLEEFLEMNVPGRIGYVLDFSKAQYADFIRRACSVEVLTERYAVRGDSMAKRLRTFWDIESDAAVALLLSELITYASRNTANWTERRHQLAERCRAIVARLTGSSVNLDSLIQQIDLRNATQLRMTIERMQSTIDSDPSLAIGSAKELIESCCRTVLKERGIDLKHYVHMHELVDQALRAVPLVPRDIERMRKGEESVQRIAESLASLAHGLTDLRNGYGTGHGRDAHAKPLTARHARLAVSAAAAMVTFMLEED
jgi:hypothetical protein